MKTDSSAPPKNATGRGAHIARHVLIGFLMACGTNAPDRIRYMQSTEKSGAVSP